MKNYTVIPNEIILNRTISVGARFTWIYIHSMRADWTFFQDKMAEDLGVTKKTLRGYIKELVSVGLLDASTARHSIKRYSTRLSGNGVKFTHNEVKITQEVGKNYPSNGVKITPLTITQKNNYSVEQSAHACACEREFSYEDFLSMYGKAPSSDQWCRKAFASLAPEEIAQIRENLPRYVESVTNVRYLQDPQRYLQERTFQKPIVNHDPIPSYKPVVETQLEFNAYEHDLYSEEYEREEERKREAVRRGLLYRERSRMAREAAGRTQGNQQ